MLLLVLFNLSIVYADGGFFKNQKNELLMPLQKVAIFNINNEETLIIQSEFYGSLDEFIWIIPVPEKPQVKTIKANIFTELEDAIYIISDPADTNSTVEDNKEEKEKNDDLNSARILDIKIYSSFDEEFRLQYLKDKKGYNLGINGKNIINDYLDKKYYFILVKIHALSYEKKPEKWIIPTLLIKFASKQNILPIRLHSRNLKDTRLKIFIFDTSAIKDSSIFSSGNPCKSIKMQAYFKNFPNILEIFPPLRENKYYLNNYDDTIKQGDDYEDLVFDPLVINRNKYINSLLDTTQNTSQRLQAIKYFSENKNPDILNKFKNLLRDKNSTLVIHSAITLWEANKDPDVPEILINQFKKTCQPYYYDCYPPKSDRSFIEIFTQLGIKEAVPLLVEIVNKLPEDTSLMGKNKSLPVHIIRTLEAMDKLGTMREAVPGLLYVLEFDKYYYYKPIMLAAKLLGDIGSESILPVLTDLAQNDWGGSTANEAWPYYGLRDAANESSLKIRLRNIEKLEDKLLYLHKILKDSKNIEETYNAVIVLMRFGERDNAENIFLDYLKMNDHVYGAANIALELKLKRSLPILAEILEKKKGNVPDPVYKVIEEFDTTGISFKSLVKVVESNPNPHPVKLALEILSSNGTEETITLLKSSDLIDSETKNEIISNIEKRIK
ncbi:MAG: DUF2330 domain-containing protein [Candidatus Firestonebacteria bacterium]|nr:DUF2330 domain-containing protein [Candidatus Firestonebacteria bacterium]